METSSTIPTLDYACALRRTLVVRSVRLVVGMTCLVVSVLATAAACFHYHQMVSPLGPDVPEEWRVWQEESAYIVWLGWPIGLVAAIIAFHLLRKSISVSLPTVAEQPAILLNNPGDSGHEKALYRKSANLCNSLNRESGSSVVE